MRVAMIVNGFPELSEKFIINQVVGLLEAGLEVDVFSGVAPTDTKKHSLVERYGLEQRTIRVGIPRSTRARLARLPGLALASLAADPAGSLAAMSARYTTASRNFKNLYFLRAFRGRHYDILHCQFGPNGLIGAFLKDRGFAERLVVTFHGSDINSYPLRHGAGVYRTLYDRADALTSGSGFTRAKLIANGCPESKLEVLPVGVWMSDFPEAPFAARRPFRLVSVGRLAEVKGYRYAIEAFAQARKLYSDAEYLIAGAGSERTALERQAAELGLGSSLRFLGAQTDTEVAELYCSASVFVLASLKAANGAEEGQGLVLQEAQAAGLPVVATLSGGIAEGVREGETGFLVPPADPESMANRICRLFGDSPLRESMGRSGRAFVSSNYDLPVLTARLVAIYERLMERDSG